VTGTQLDWSDIDVFISWREFLQISHLQRTQYRLEIQDLMIECSGLSRVELHFFQDLPLTIQFQVIREGKIIYERTPNARPDFVERLFPRYYDFMIWYNRHLKESIPH